jgi:predicted TIM-barrel fold metal-dependent hydrolase
MIVDAQLHDPIVWGDWSAFGATVRRELLTELQLAYMTAVGVDCALLFPVDLAWGEEAAARLPERFAVVRMITPDGVLSGLDPAAPDIEELVAAEREKPTTVGLRILPAHLPRGGDGFALLQVGGYDRALRACDRNRLPVFVSTMGNLDAPAVVARRFPELTVVVDHLGLRQPPVLERDDPPFREVPALVALAALPNVAVKLSGLPSLSVEGHPFRDVWDHLEPVLAAFGVERLLWGSDISRFYGRIGFEVRFARGAEPYPGRHTYAESLHLVRDTDRLSVAEKEWLLGRTAQRLLGWPRAREVVAAA